MCARRVADPSTNCAVQAGDLGLQRNAFVKNEAPGWDE